MNLFHVLVPAALLLVALTVQANDQPDTGSTRVLFVYDTVDKASRFYVEAFRELLAKEPFQVEEASAGELRHKDPSSYDCVVIYGMVMAFNMKSMVRKWVKAQKNMENRKVFVFVTANRWFNNNLRKDLVNLATKRRATVVDAVSMATNKVSDADKREKIQSFLAGVKR
jgi:uncharacterized protein YdaL